LPLQQFPLKTAECAFTVLFPVLHSIPVERNCLLRFLSFLCLLTFPTDTFLYMKSDSQLFPRACPYLCPPTFPALHSIFFPKPPRLAFLVLLLSYPQAFFRYVPPLSRICRSLIDVIPLPHAPPKAVLHSLLFFRS